MNSKYENILQWNCRGIKLNVPELQLIITETNPVAICLQETKLNTELFQLRGYSAYHHITSKKIACGGSSIFIKTNILHRKINTNSEIQAVAIRFTLGRPLTMCSIYIPPDQNVSYYELHSLVKELPKPILLLGDFNAHSPLWGSHKSNSKGKIIEKLLEDENLCILNDGTPTFYSSINLSPSYLDLTIIDSNLYTEFTWNVMDENCGSDHQPILLTTRSKNTSEIQEKWNFHKADWNKFQIECNKILTQINEQSNAEEKYSTFVQSLLQICECTIPKVKQKLNKQRPWFTNTCKEYIQDRNKKLRIFRTKPTPENLIAFKIARAKARQTIREQKRHTWQNYVSKINSRTPINDIWKMIRKIKGNTSKSSIKQIKLAGGNYAETAKDISNEIGQCFSKNSSSENYLDSFKMVKDGIEKETINFETNTMEYYNLPITINELTKCINETKNTAPGPDKIHNEIIKHLPTLTLNTLLRIFNDIWQENTFPKEWHKAITIPIPKEQKDHTDPINYRPIALTNCLCKIMEKIINKRLNYFLETNDLIAKTQCGFRRNHSTTDHLIGLETYIREAFVRKEHVVAIFFDIEKAFDTTWKYGILRDLYDMGLRGNLPIFIANFLKNRTFQVRIGNCLSDTFIQEEGVPQGSILSPTLFNIKINKITGCLISNTKCSLYVDDFTIYYRAKCLTEIKNHLQLQIDKIQKWTEDNGFKFSTQKTQVMHFYQMRKKYPEPVIFLYGKQIPVTTSIKFLGITLDPKLNFLQHIKNIKYKCQRSINLLKILTNTDWGGEKNSLLKIYRSNIRSKIDYGCIVYGSTRKSYLKMLDPIHNQCTRLCLGAFRTTPCHSLQIEANEPPLQNRRKKLSLQYTLKLKSLPNNPAYLCVFYPQEKNNFHKYPNNIPTFGLRIDKDIRKSNIELNGIQKYNMQKTPPWMFEIPQINLELKNRKGKDDCLLLFQEIMRKYPNHDPIYTDG